MCHQDRVKGGLGIHAARANETDLVKGGVGIHAARAS